MNRRDFARTVIGAIVGTSAIPAFGEKPLFKPCLHEPIYIAGMDPAFGSDSSFFCIARFSHDGTMVSCKQSGSISSEKVSEIISNFESNKDFLYEDVSTATKLHLKEQWG